MSHFRLHTIKERTYLRYLILTLAGLTVAAVLGFAIHSIGTARAKSRETVLIFTEEEFTQYLVDQTSEEYNLNGSYRLEDDLDLSSLEQSIGSNLEPFSGSFDGNGHVIAGLKRPLFGVMETAKVENLFLSGAEIQHPFTYQSGEHFTDGYGALAAYVIGSEVRNCGMNGTILTASPAEAEYLVARATSADADEMEEIGPGVEGAAGEDPAGNEGGAGNGGAAEESSPFEDGGAGGGEASPGGSGEGPGADVIPGPTSATDAGPGVETGENGRQTETEKQGEEGPGTEPADATSSGSEPDSGKPTESSTSESEHSASTENQEDGAGKNEEIGKEEIESESHSDSSTENATDSSIDISTEKTEPEKVESTESNTESLAGSGQSGSSESKTKAGKENATEAGAEADPTEDAGTAIEETIGFRSNDRHHLLMKIPEVMDFNMESLSTSTPSDAMEATPSDAQEGPGGGQADDESLEAALEDAKGPGVNTDSEESFISQESETTQTPEGDVYIRVTADRVAVGGLVAETTGETLIAESFVLVTIDSNVEQTDTYAGGMTGIVGSESRLENSYATGLVDAAGVAGGFAAANDGVIQNSYSSMTIGKRGEVRRAFIASGEGTVSSCVYDKQMACAEEGILNVSLQTGELENPELPEVLMATGTQADEMPEFTLKGLNTSQMTGLEAEISGEWYLAENAYPQLEYFALSSQEMTESSSKASAVALTLPDGVTLEDVLEEGTVTVPGEVDGQQIIWETDGQVQINGKNQVILEESATRSSHQAPVVQSALEAKPAVDDKPDTDLADPSGTDETTSSEAVTAGGSLKASVGGATKQFMLSAVVPKAAMGSYATWDEVAVEVETGGSLAHLQPKKAADGWYEVETPEAMAWLGYKMNQKELPVTTNIRLMADLDLFGGTYSSKEYDQTINNIEDALKWNPITIYQGDFDGGGHELHHIRISVADAQKAGFFAEISDAVISNFGIASGNVENTGAGVQTGALVGRIGGNSARIINCWNHADVTAGGAVGGMVGYALEGVSKVERCYNTGTITATGVDGIGGAGGIVGTVQNANITIKNCYNAGIVSSQSQGSGGAGGILGSQSVAGAGNGQAVNCYNVGNVSGIGDVGGIIGFYKNADGSKNCYYLNTTGTDSHAVSLSDSQMKSWAFPFALNGQDIKGVWSNQKGSYPVFAEVQPRTAAFRSANASDADTFAVEASALDNPADWSVIGQGGLDGLIAAGKLTVGNGSAGNPYQISTVEQLAAVVQFINNGNPATCVKLMDNFDLFGSQYTGFTGEHTLKNITNALKWIPIGKSSVLYQGTFDGNCHTVDGVYIDGSYLSTLGNGASLGFFSHITGSCVIKKFGIEENTRVYTAGRTGGLFLGNAIGAGTPLIEDCYVRGEATGTIVRYFGVVMGDDGVPCNLTIRNFFNAARGAKFSATDRTYTINCYGDVSVDSRAATRDKTFPAPPVKAVTSRQLKTWGGAYALNGFKMDGAWTFDPMGENYPTWGTLPPARDWRDVGQMQYCRADIVPLPNGNGTKENPYLLATAEQLASFEAEVDWGRANIHGVLTENINLAGKTEYGGYSQSNPLPWRPIGDNNRTFTGNLNGKGKTISYMKIRFDGYAGLVGVAGGGTEIRGIGLDDTCSVEAVETTPGSYDFDGTGAFVGAVKSDGTSKPQIVIKNCYNRGSVKGRTGNATGAFVGTFVGNYGVGGQRITNCYTAGPLSTTTGENPGAIAGKFVSNPNDLSSGIRYCYWDSQTSGTVAGAAADSSVVNISESREMTSQEMRMEAAVLELLNTEVETGVWSRTLDVNIGYPIYGETAGAGVTTWEDVGRYHLSPPYKHEDRWGSAGRLDNPHLLSTPEDLAWFAYQVNHGNTGICGELTADINLFGDKYTGITYDETDPGMKTKGLFWVPAGSGADPLAWDKAYVGEFQGNGHVISLMNVQAETQGGLFGYVYGAGQTGKTGKIMGTGIENSYIEASQAGGITGRAGGVAEVSQCFVRGGTVVNTDGSTDARAGGIAGYVDGMGRIEDCYIMEAEVLANGTGNIAGGIIGRKAAGGQVESCYSQMTTGGKIEGTKRGSIVGRQIGSGGEETIGNMYQCYSDVGIVGDPDTIKKLVIQESDTLTQEIVNDLNVKNRRERTGTDRAWYTSLSTEPTKGYPTLVPPQFINVTIPSAASSGGRKVNLPKTVTGALLRGIRQEYGEGHPAFTLKPGTEVSGAYSTWGTDSSNERLGLVTGAGQDLAGLMNTVASASGALTDPTVSAGTINALTLYNGAAYTYGKSRVIITDVASGGVRYEIRATIPGAAEKTLNVVLPVKVGIEDLSPDGSLKKSYSADLTLTNNNDYPIAGNTLRLIPMTGEGYVTLKPVAKTDPYGSTKQLADPAGGIKVGIADTKAGGGIVPAAGIYYTPANNAVNPPVAEKWMEYQIKGKGTLPYRYFMEYEANPYYSDTNQYGYTVSYQFGISKDDVPAGVTAVAK